MPLIQHDVRLFPGAEFGPLSGKAHGTFGDFSWPFLWTPLIQEEKYHQLQTLNLQLPSAASTQIEFVKASGLLKFVEPEIIEHARLASKVIPVNGWETCDVCGRAAVKKPEKVIVDASSIPENLDMFRMTDLTTFILVTDRFKAAVEALQLSDITFNEVEVS